MTRLVKCGKAVLLAILLLRVGDAGAKVPATNIRELATRSKAIAIVEVKSIRSAAGLRWADAVVVSGLKGVTAGEMVTYLAEPTWTCDISAAEVGEVSLVFLTDARDENVWWGFKDPDRDRLPSNSYLLAWHGRGRMPVRAIKQVQYVTIWSYDVGLPQSVQSVSGPDPQYDFIRSYKLSDILALVKQHVARRGA